MQKQHNQVAQDHVRSYQVGLATATLIILQLINKIGRYVLRT